MDSSLSLGEIGILFAGWILIYFVANYILLKLLG